MSDKELIAFLRDLPFLRATAAADRIEELTVERDEHWKSFVHWRKEADDLTEQLEAARADAKEAEAYAEELEKQLNICRMAQVVMDNGIAEVEKERDDYAFKLADANNTYSEMHVALSEANDKLEKAVEALRFYADLSIDGPWHLPSEDYGKRARATLAEIESSEAVTLGEKG
jgi:chromosome segregation ATPase